MRYIIGFSPLHINIPTFTDFRLIAYFIAFIKTLTSSEVYVFDNDTGRYIYRHYSAERKNRLTGFISDKT